MLNRAAVHAESQDLSRETETKAARRKWNPALHPRDHKGRFIETGGIVRLWGGKRAIVRRALPNDRILVQDAGSDGKFTGRRHSTSAKWVTMIARPDGSAPTADEDKVAAEDERRDRDSRRGNGVAQDDDGDPTTPNDPHDNDDQGKPIGDDEGDGPDDEDDQDEAALPNTRHVAGARFADTAAVRAHFTQLADQPGQSPKMVRFLRAVAGDRDFWTAPSGRLVILRDDESDRWYLTSVGTGQRMGAAGDFDTAADALKAAVHIDRSVVDSSGTPFDFSDPDLDQAARTWQSNKGENIQDAIIRAQKTTTPRAAATAPAEPAPTGRPGTEVPRADLKPGDRITVTITNRDLEWPDSTRRTDKPKTVTVEGTVAPTYSPSPSTTGTPLIDVTLTGPDGTALATGEAVHVRRMPATAGVSERRDGYAPEQMRADQVRVGDVIARGTFGHVVTEVNRSPRGPGFTTRSLDGSSAIDEFSLRSSEQVDVIPRARRRPEDVQRDVLGAVQQHANSTDAKRAAQSIISDWQRANELAMKLWPDGVPEPFTAMRRNLQNVTATPNGAEGYQQNAEAIRGALTAINDLETDGLDAGLLKALHRLEANLDGHVDKFAADARAITANKEKRRQQELQSRPPVEGLDDEQLRAEHDELISGDHGPAGESRLEAIKRERRDRDKRAITDRADPQTLSRSALLAEQAEFARTRTSYESDDVADARRQRMAAVNTELELREAESAAPAKAQPDAAEPDEPLRHAWDDPDQLITVTMPKELVDFLYVDETAPMEDPDTRKALSESAEGRNGARKVTAPVSVHRELLEGAWTLAGGEGLESDPGEARAYREYTKRVDKAADKIPARAPKNDAPPAPEAPEAPEGDGSQSGTVTLTPDEVSEQLDAVRPGGSKAPSSMSDAEIREESVALMEQEMANGGELTGADRTRLRVLEAEEARRAGRAPKREEPKPKAPVEEPGGLFDSDEPAGPQRAADLNNPDDRPADAFGTPDMFAAAEGRDTTRLRPAQMRRPEDLAVGDRFIDAEGLTHTVEEAPVRTGRGRVRVTSGDGRQHFLARDTELRVLYPDETAPDVPGRDEEETTPAAPDGGSSAPPSADGPAAEEPNAAPDQIRIEHTGSGTVVRFPGPDGRASDEDFAMLRSLGFKRSRTQQMFYLPSTWTLSTRDERIRKLKDQLDRQNVPYEAADGEPADRPELSDEQQEQLSNVRLAPLGTWALTEFQPGDEVWTGSSWDRIDSVGPKNVRLQRWGTTAYDRILARRRGSEIRTVLDAPPNDGMPRPGVDDPERLSDSGIEDELEQLRAATLPDGTDPAQRTVRRQVTARIRALSDQQSARTRARTRAETERRNQAALVRDPERLAAMKAQQVQGRGGAPIGIVYQEGKGKWRFVDRDGRMITPNTPYPTRAAAINAANTLTDRRNERAGDGWTYAPWDDVRAGDSVRVPELGRSSTGRGRQVTGWSEPIEVTDVSRDATGQVTLSGRRGEEDVTLQIPRTDATFGTSKPGTVPDREPSDAGGGMLWQQMQPEDFGRDVRPDANTGVPDSPLPPDEFGTPDLIANGEQPQASADSADPEVADTPEDRQVAPPAPIGEQAGRDLDDAAIDAELQALQEWQNRHVMRSSEGPHVQGNVMRALSPVANRRAELNDVQRERESAERQLQEREEKARRKAEALGRALIGKRNADGTYPVSVDDREIGTVRQLGRQWMFKHEDGSESGLDHPTRGDAVAALVELDDLRKQQEVERAQQEAARKETPDGWVRGDRAELAENDVIRVPVTQTGHDGRPYPVRWRDPVRVRSVERNDNGTMSLSVDNLDGTRSDLSSLGLANLDAGFVWREGRTRPEPTPAWRHELRNRMADIGDDIATLHRLEGFEDQERIGALAGLIRRVETHRSPDLSGDLRSIVAETAWLEEQFDNPDLPYETRSRRSWATAANRKAQSALANPDFQQIPPRQDSTGNPAWTLDLGEGVWIDRPRSADSPNGPSGAPRNIYVGGRIEGLIGRERPRGNYFWWRPGGQTGEGRYASAEEAARGFARDLRETNLPSLPARRADDESNRPDPGQSNSQTGGEETSAEPTGGFVTGGVTANADVAAHMTEIASRHDAVRALGTDPGLARQLWEQARTAFAENNPRSGLSRLQDAERHAWHEIRRLEANGANSDAIEALKTWAVSMNHARVRMTSTPGPGERYVTYGELRPGDVLRWPYVNGYAVWGEPTSPQAPPDHELWANPMYLDGQSSNSQMSHPRTNLALVSDDAEAIDAARQALLARRSADEENLANRRRELEAARAERAEAARPAVEGELVEPGNLAVGDEVNVSGRNNRGQDRTWRGRLLAEPRLVTVQRGGQRAKAWRLHIGEEGQEPTLGNMLTVGVDERVDRIGTPNRTEERDAPGRTGDDAGRDRGDQDAADSTAGPEASQDSDREQREDNGREEQRNRRRGNDRDGEAGGPDGGPDGDGPDAPGMPGGTGEGDGPNRDANDEERKRRRRRRSSGNGTGGSGGSGRPGGPRLPRLNLPDSDSSADTRSPAGESGDGEGDTAPRPRPRRTSIDDQRQAWSSGEDLTPAEDIPERRAHLAQLAARDGLALSESGGLVMWREPQPDGSTHWRFAQARTGNRLANITLTSSDPEEARALAGRFEEIADANGDAFDWQAQWDRSTVAQWRDGEGRNLPDALLAVREDYRQEREGAFALPDDLTGLTDDELAAAYGNGLSPSDTMRLMAEMDRRDDTDQKIRAAVPETPPADAEEAERRGRAMDEALGFGDTDVTRPAPATPGRLRREFDALDAERFAAAMQETGGTFFNAGSQDSGVDPRALFSGRSVTAARARELASDELRDWFDRNDGRLTYSTYSQRERDRVLRAEFEEIDEARYRAAEAATNGYFFRRQHDGGTISDRELFSGGSLSQFDRWRDIASEELRDWFDANGGRLTFNQFKNARRADDRVARDLYEEERRANEGRDESTAPDTAATSPSSNENAAKRPEEDSNAQADGANPAGADTQPAAPSQGEDSVALRDLRAGDIIQALPGEWHVVLSTPGDRTRGSDLWLDTWSLDNETGLFGFRPADQMFTRNETPDLVDRGRPVLDAQMRSRADVAAATDRRERSAARQAEHSTQQPPAEPQPGVRRARRPVTDTPGTTVTPNQLAEGDAVRVTGRNNRGATVTFEGLLLAQPDETTTRRDGNTVPVWRLYVGEEGDARNPGNRLTIPMDAEVTRLEGLAPHNFDETPETAPDGPGPDDAEAPQPIGGQPAHWARVDDLVPGDTVRMTGTTRRGRHVQRAGFVSNPPVRVEVTRRGRTEHMWRTWVTQNADGTGDAGNVYTSLNATAARAESPDDVVPGSPASGAQSSLLAGDLPDTIPADREGRGIFPGSTVTSTNDREGTVTGATTNTVAVDWADGRNDTTVAPATLSVTGENRADGWTAAGQRVRPTHIVSDVDGALLGPVDEVDGDRVTVATATGPVTRSAGDLQVTGEVRDEAPAPGPIADIDNVVAADLSEGDTLLLDEDGALSVVEIVGAPSRNGDRVTFEWASPVTGEMGESDVDASAVLQRALGHDGGRPDLSPDEAPEPPDDMTVHEPARPVDPVTGPTVDPGLTMGDRTVIGDHADGPDTNPDAQQAAARITADLPVTPEQAAALAAHLRESADPSTGEGRAALRAADHLDAATGRTPPPGLDRPRPSNAAQLAEGDTVAMPDERRNNQMRVFRVLDIEEGPGGVRRLLLEDENQQWRRRTVHGAMPVWQLPEAQPDPVTPPDTDPTATPAAPPAPATPSAPPAPAPSAPAQPVAQLLPGVLRTGDVIDAPTSRTGYQFNGHRRLTLISTPHRNGWWMQLTGIDDDGNVHDFGLHSGRAVNVYERNRPTPALPPAGAPRDPNPAPQSDTDRLTRDHGRSLSARIIDEAIAGTEPAGTIHALREQIAQRLTPDALRAVRQQVRQEGTDALDTAGITGPDRDAARQAFKQARRSAHAATVRAALRTINDLEPLPDESEEDLAARARDLLRLIPAGIAARQDRSSRTNGIADTVAAHAERAMSALMQQLQDAGVDPGDAERIARMLVRQLDGSRQDTARRIARRVTAASPAAAQQPGLLAGIVALLVRIAKRLAELVKAGARKIAEKWQDARERVARLRAFFARTARRVRQWPESRRLARLQRAVNLPSADGDSLSARVAHWAGLMPEPGHFGQTNRRVTWWRPTTWGQLAAGNLPDRSDRIQWAPDQAADGGPGLTALRHMAALRAAGGDVDEDVTRRLASTLGDDFGDDPHSTLQEADDHVAESERRLVTLRAARSGATLPDDPDLEVEISAAQAELTDARNTYESLRARYAAAVPEAVAAALAELRDMGPEGSTSLVFGPDSDADAERAVQGVQRLIPRAWLASAPVRRVTAVSGLSGRYEPGTQRITVADLADDGLGTAGHALAQHLARHLGDLDAAQRVFWFTRTHTGRPGARRMRQTALGRLLSRQQTQPETGDTLARSVQSMFSGDWYQDDDLRAFLLGLLATR
ncbi:hypothetical protein ACIBCC_30205 [Streptomyces griseus]|uniref:hypothetical protein n=1 Tax=Streptomyces griseus TaxID=1911 RepID=UPI003798D4F7